MTQGSTLGEIAPAEARVVALVGQPNVGKSSVFRALTGRYATVANYPGTTVEVYRGTGPRPEVEIVDTPGLMALPARNAGEEVTIRLLMEGTVATIVQVGDAKNLRRTILLAAQLAELGLPMVVGLNMTDEARERGIAIDERLLSTHLSVPVVPTVAITGAGIDRLAQTVEEAQPPPFRIGYPPDIEDAIAEAAIALGGAAISPRGMALLWLAGDPVAVQWVGEHLDVAARARLEEQRRALQLGFTDPISTVLQAHRLEFVERVAGSVVGETPGTARGWRWRLGRLSAHPLLGLPVLAGVLYALYLFVGVFGAGTLVDLLEQRLFGEVVNPRVAGWISDLIPVALITDFLVGEYGLWTMGMTYALALILPIVTTFFLAFGVLEDSGYLPRLSVLTNRVFRGMGLNGQAVIPMVLGLGCVTMATLTTRILETRRERALVILLLALAIPCSAQLGVVMGLLAGISFSATLIWAGVVLLVLLVVGWLTARLMPGRRSPLLVELPPLRRPRLSNVMLKTVARVEWYLKEVVPIFLAGTAILFTLDRLGALQRLVDFLEPLVVGWLGLPAAATTAFLMGFLRRDFGAAGLFTLAAAGMLGPAQLVVAMVTITLFVPCIASVLMIARERGWETATAMTAVIFPLAFAVGGVLSRGLALVGWGS